MDWNRIGTNWSELKGKAKRQLESCKDYNIDMNKNDLKQDFIGTQYLNNINQVSAGHHVFNTHNSPNSNQEPALNVSVSEHSNTANFDEKR